MNAEDIIKKFKMGKHPEGGFYSEVFRSEGNYDFEGLERYKSGKRNFVTSIYYLLKEDDFSAFHRLSSDEIWFFHAGCPVLIHIIDSTGNYKIKELSLEDNPQIIVEKNNWFAAELKDKTGYSFVSCVVAPGFEFEDFQLAKKSELLKDYPEYENVINKFTRE